MTTAPNVFGFTANVWSGGYQWAMPEEIGVKSGRLSEEDGPYIFANGPGCYVTREVTQAGLFRRFSELAADDLNSLAEFAGEFGLISWSERVELKDGRATYVESRSLWGTELWKMRGAVELLDTLREPNPSRREERLRDQFKWQPETSEWSGHWTPISLLAPFRSTNLTRVSNPIFDDRAPLESVATVFLINIVNINLSHNVWPVLTFDASGQIAERLEASKLTGLMWSQLFTAISSGREQRKCEGCGEWFEVGGKDGATRRRLHCSDVCRVRVSRKRKATESQEGASE